MPDQSLMHLADLRRTSLRYRRPAAADGGKRVCRHVQLQHRKNVGRAAGVDRKEVKGVLYQPRYELESGQASASTSRGSLRDTRANR